MKVESHSIREIEKTIEEIYNSYEVKQNPTSTIYSLKLNKTLIEIFSDELPY